MRQTALAEIDPGFRPNETLIAAVIYFHSFMTLAIKLAHRYNGHK